MIFAENVNSILPPHFLFPVTSSLGNISVAPSSASAFPIQGRLLKRTDVYDFFGKRLISKSSSRVHVAMLDCRYIRQSEYFYGQTLLSNRISTL